MIPCCDSHYCLVCCGTGWITDRRKETANDRIVQRLKEYAESKTNWNGEYGDAIENCKWFIRDIIEEEREKDK